MGHSSGLGSCHAACTILHCTWCLLLQGLNMPQVLRNTLNCTLPIEIVHNGPLEATPDVIQRFQVIREI